MRGLLRPTAKFQQPEFSWAMVQRPRLLDVLNAPRAGHVVLVQAPAGFGKSSLIAGWRHHASARTLWYSLDESDNHPEVFSHFLCAGLSMHFAFDDSNRGENCLVNLLNHLPETGEEFVLVLDNLQAIEHPEVEKKLKFLLRYLPQYITLVLISRTTPRIGIAELRAKGLLLEFNAEDLVFQSTEAHEFLNNNLPFEPSAEQVELLNLRSEGWPTALKMATVLGQSPTALDTFSEQLVHGHPHIIDYLAEELVQTLPEHTRGFLCRTAILDCFDAPLANDVLQSTDASTHIADLIRLDLFTTRKNLTQTGYCYRYHRLFAGCLQQLLAQQYPQEVLNLHQRASHAWIQRGHADKAAQHAIKAHDPQLVVDILLKQGERLYHDSHLDILSRCFAQLPADMVYTHPMLTLLQAWVFQGQNKYDEALTLLGKAEACLRPRYSADEWNSLQSDFAAVRAQLAMNVGQADEAVRWAQLAQKHPPLIFPYSQTSAQSVLGELNFVNGKLPEALACMQETEVAARAQGASRIVLWTLCQQAEIAMARGFLQQAYNTLEKALTYSIEKNLPQTLSLDFIYRLRSQILCEWHQVEEAERCALKCLEILEGAHERWKLQAYTLLAKISLMQGKQNLCANYIRRMVKLLATWDYHLDWVANAEATLLIYWIEVHDQDSIHQWLNKPFTPPAVSNHFGQCTVRNRARGLIAMDHFDEARDLMQMNIEQAVQCGLVLDQTRNHIVLAHLNWACEQRSEALTHLNDALTLSNTSGILGSFLRVGKPLINMVKALQSEMQLGEYENYRADRLIALSQQQRTFRRAIRITLDEAIIQDIINRPDVPELIRISPLTRREWQVLSLIQAGISNEQIAAQLDVAPTTIKTHIRNLYQKIGVANRVEAVALANDLLAKIQGE